jgi:GNAT superfamily N-acetyltransferase
MIGVLAPDDRTGITEIASLHSEALPTSNVSKLGPSYTRSWYRFAAASQLEEAFVAHDASGAVIGGAMLTLSPEGLAKRILLHTPMIFHLAVRPRLAFRLALDKLRSEDHASKVRGVPEVIAIFVNSAYRSQQVGKRLLAFIEGWLRHRGATCYAVRTEDNPNNRAIAFYLREGFQAVSRFQAHGISFQLLMKQI